MAKLILEESTDYKMHKLAILKGYKHLHGTHDQASYAHKKSNYKLDFNGNKWRSTNLIRASEVNEGEGYNSLGNYLDKVHRGPDNTDDK